jgi:hypothetical protein
MNIIFLLFFIIVTILIVYNHSSVEEKMEAYIREREGTFVSEKREYFDVVSLLSKHGRSYKLVYYDKNKILRAVLVRVSSYGSVDFIDDHAVDSNSEKYFVDKKRSESPKKEIKDNSKPLVDYSYTSDKGALVIRQEYYQPNNGEEVFLNGEKAPTGKYKIGFMNFVAVEDGKVKGLSMT